MLLEALLDDGQDFFVHQARDGVLHHALFFGECAADVKKINRIQHNCSK
jgi:hypothetical protein